MFFFKYFVKIARGPSLEIYSRPLIENMFSVFFFFHNLYVIEAAAHVTLGTYYMLSDRPSRPFFNRKSIVVLSRLTPAALPPPVTDDVNDKIFPTKTRYGFYFMSECTVLKCRGVLSFFVWKKLNLYRSAIK